MTEMTVMEPRELQAAACQMMQAVQGMAEMIRMTNERLTSLEELVRRQEKLTPMQVREISRLIRDRAEELRQEYRLGPSTADSLASAIRRGVRLLTGTRSAKEISRCDWRVVTAYIATWEDVREIRKIGR